METKTNQKSSTAYLFNCYVWLLNTIARGPISRAAIDEKWKNSSANDYKQDHIPESNFHRWKNTVELLFGVEIKHNAYNEYYIEDAANLRGADLRMRMVNIMSINNLLKDSEELSDQILFEPVPSGEKFLTPIIEALRDKCLLMITYHGFGKKHPHTFPVEPYCLKMFKQRWYLLAYSSDIKQMRVYSLDRIQDIKVTDKHYKLPKNFDANAYFQRTYGVSAMMNKPEIIRFRVSAFIANYLRTLPLHPTQKEVVQEEEYSEFEIFAAPSFELKQEFLTHGSELKVLQPQWLRDEIVSDLKSQLANYDK